ncbi:MAG: Gram-negative bacterial tonB protein [Mucilaginibacter sp.]|nr:Gram-negative bacterial tonB protein [Mucilaginibacter sp.]
MLIEKLADSAYSVREYNLRDTVIFKGTYKDSLMNVPNGRFTYYTKKILPEVLNGVAKGFDTNNYISKVGYFLNGEKTGLWIELGKRNFKRCSYFYKNNMLNGTYTRYDNYHKDYIIEEGTYIDDKREGDWNFYGYDTLKTPVATQIYKNNKIVKEITHYKPVEFPNGIPFYLKKRLKTLDTVMQNGFEAEITIAESGEIKEPKIITLFSAEVTNTLVDVLRNMPKFIPEFYDGKPKAKRYKFMFARKVNVLDNGVDVILGTDVGNGMILTQVYGSPSSHRNFDEKEE